MLVHVTAGDDIVYVPPHTHTHLSWYPKPYKPDLCSSGNSQGNSLGTLSSGHLYPSGKQKSLGEDPRQYHHPHYELTKVLSLEVPQPSGASYGMGCNNTPSPKPSPGKPRSPPKKKMSSSSPGEREGYYPCNRCGRSAGNLVVAKMGVHLRVCLGCVTLYI